MVTSAHTDLQRRGRRLEYATTVWNCTEAIVAIVTGLAANSLALVAFGLDSCVEVFASVVVLWHLGGADEEADPRRARRAVRLIAAAFAVLGLYLLAQAVRGFVTRITPESSPLGTAFIAATVVVMFSLAWGKRRTGRALASRPLVADASMTFIDGCLAAGVLAVKPGQAQFAAVDGCSPDATGKSSREIGIWEPVMSSAVICSLLITNPI
jgi:divalent metal cation (Fe/Co/Zn/Cd) transporter